MCVSSIFLKGRTTGIWSQVKLKYLSSKLKQFRNYCAIWINSKVRIIYFNLVRNRFSGTFLVRRKSLVIKMKREISIHFTGSLRSAFQTLFVKHISYVYSFTSANENYFLENLRCLCYGYQHQPPLNLDKKGPLPAGKQSFGYSDLRNHVLVSAHSS